jgi:hypothetical protein
MVDNDGVFSSTGCDCPVRTLKSHLIIMTK